MNAVNSKENVEKERLSKDDPTVIIIWDADRSNIRCVFDMNSSTL